MTLGENYIPGAEQVVKDGDDWRCRRCNKKIIPLMIEMEVGETETPVCEDCFLDGVIEGGMKLGSAEVVEPKVGEAVGDHDVCDEEGVNPYLTEEEEMLWENFCC